MDDPAEGSFGVFFFVPLPEPLGLEDGEVIPELRAPDVVEALRDGIDIEPQVRISVRYWVVAVPSHSLIVAPSLFGLAARAFELSGPPEWTSGTEVPEEWTGVAEIAVALDGPPATGDDALDAQLTTAFEQGVEHVKAIQSAYHVATDHPVRLMSKRHMPPVVPYVLARMGPDGRPHPVGDPAVFLLNPTAMSGALRPDPLTDEQRERFEVAASLEPDHPFLGYVDLRREARVLWEFDGDVRPAVVAAQSAAETMLNVLLLMMMWEEETAPQDAARVLADPRFAARVRSEFPPRLGGNWGTGGPVGDYEVSLLHLRNRVVHSSHCPTREEAERALTALFDLERFVADRLAEDRNRTRCARTATLFLGEAGLRRRGVWTRKLRELRQNDEEPHWVSTFGRWQRVVEDEWFGSSHQPAPPESLVAVQVFDEDHEGEWYLHDREGRMAIRASAPHLTAEAAAAMRAVVSAMRSTGHLVPFSQGYLGQPSTAAEGAEWEREHLVLPEYHLFCSDTPARRAAARGG